MRAGWSWIALAVSVAGMGLLDGCGQKGPLYLPDRGTVVTRPAGAAAPGTAAPRDQRISTPPQSASPAPADQSQPGQSAPGTAPRKADDRKDDDDSQPPPR